MRLSASVVLPCLLALCACSYDFDGAFAGKGSTGGQASSMGGSGGSGGTASGSSGGAGGGGVPSGEQCFNGVDDDDDGLVDCADPECRAATCAEAAPEGWGGPSPLYLGDPDAAPTCPAGLTPVAGGTGAIDAEDASCAACSCSAPSGGACGIGTVTIYESSGVCSGGIDTIVTPSAPNDCSPFFVGGAGSGALGEPIPIDSPGSCQPSGGAATVPPASFVEAALLCGDSKGVGCGDDVCVPAAAAPFAQLCIFTDGNVDCPDGPYSAKTLLFTGIDDDRECSDCSCEPATGQACTGTTELHRGSNCSNLDASVPHDGTSCESFTVFTPSASALFIPGGGPNGGSCPTDGGEPEGSVSPMGPIVVCCLPDVSD